MGQAHGLYQSHVVRSFWQGALLPRPVATGELNLAPNRRMNPSLAGCIWRPLPAHDPTKSCSFALLQYGLLLPPELLDGADRPARRTTFHVTAGSSRCKWDRHHSIGLMPLLGQQARPPCQT